MSCTSPETFPRVSWDFARRAEMMNPEAERDDLHLLQALCQAADATLVRHACLVLGAYPWTLQEHAVVCECCAALAACGVRIDSRRLAAQLTRAGFPDVDLDALFVPLPFPDRELARRLDALQRGKR